MQQTARTHAVSAATHIIIALYFWMMMSSYTHSLM